MGGLDWVFLFSNEGHSGDIGQIHASGNGIARLARRLMNSNFYAPFALYHLVLPHLRASNEGHIAVVCSQSGNACVRARVCLCVRVVGVLIASRCSV